MLDVKDESNMDAADPPPRLAWVLARKGKRGKIVKLFII